jgi:hypothetical protein
MMTESFLASQRNDQEQGGQLSKKNYSKTRMS